MASQDKEITEKLGQVMEELFILAMGLTLLLQLF